MRTIAVVNQKGGCGKTTTTINLAAFLALKERRTLIVDLDPQGHSTVGLLPAGTQGARGMYDVFMHRTNGHATSLPDIVQPVDTNLDVAPTDILLSAVPEQLAGSEHREMILAEALSAVSGRYDYVLVDCPPHVGLLTFNAIRACDEAIVPVDPSFFSLHGIGKLLETFDVVARKTGHEIAARALVTLYSGRSQFARDVVEEIRKHLDGRSFDTIIRHSIKLAEAASHGLPISRYCRRCAGFDDYDALASEILEMEGAPRSAGEPTEVSDEAPAPSAPLITPAGVYFAIDAPGAQRVHLVGDFNGWSADGPAMTRTGTVWTSLVALPPGRYRYRYVIDGDWRSDPLNMEVEPAPYGGHNSVLVVNAASEGALDAG
jgi:chromosome partitioning protein